MQGDDRVPDLFVRGRAIYPANLNATNPVGTVQSIEHTLRNFDKVAADQKNRVTRVEKELADYRPQADRPFEHEERLKQLLTRQAELNSVLDLDKGYEGAVLVAEESEIERADPSPLENHETVARMAAAYMRKSELLCEK